MPPPPKPPPPLPPKPRIVREGVKSKRPEPRRTVAVMLYIVVDRRELDQANLEFDEMHACVVIAKDVDHAREIASRDAYEEGPEVWFDPKRSSVQVLGTVPDDKLQSATVVMGCVAS